MERADRKTLLYIDLESARTPVEGAESTVGVFAERVVAFGRTLGRILGAIAYGNVNADEAKELKRSGCEVRLTSEDGEGSAPESIAIALDAMEAACRGPLIDSIVVVTDDAQLGELVRRLRRQGRYVAVVSPAGFAGEEPSRSADHAVTVESLLQGTIEVAPEPLADVSRVSARPPVVPRPRPTNGQTIDFATYDWTRLVLLMRDLEAKMPFVGMRWLKNKVIGPHNVGAETIADKQLLLNRAVDDGLIETYRVGNRDETGDPVTACKLIRTHERVTAILDAHPAPPPVVALQTIQEAS
jgi:hypothetical protein